MNIRKFEFEAVDFTKLLSATGEQLVPAVVVDSAEMATDGLASVLMVGFMNRLALEATIDSGNVTFYSRTSQALWEKGTTSGNYLKVRNIFTDCDNDSILIDAEPLGPTCCQGTQSCFEEEIQ